MKIPVYIKIALRNILRHPVKNATVGIIILVSCLVFFINGSMINNCQTRWRAFLSTTVMGHYHVGTYKGMQWERDNSVPPPRLPDTFLPDELLSYLEKNRVAYTRRLRQGGVVYNYKTAQFEGTLANFIATDVAVELSHLTNLKIVEGTYDPELENGVLVWKEYADKLEWKVGDEITMYLEDVEDNRFPFSFVVTGLVENKTGFAFKGEAGILSIFPTIFAERRIMGPKIGAENDACTEVAVWDSSDRFTGDIRDIAERHGNTFFFAEEGYGVVLGFVQLIETVGAFLQFFILVTLIIASININMMSFMERRREIGTLIAMGGRTKWIVSILLSEMFIFSVIAFAASVLVYTAVDLAIPGGIYIESMKRFFAGHSFMLDIVLRSVVTSFVSIISVVFISSLYPIYLMTRIDPVEVFREGEV